MPGPPVSDDEVEKIRQLHARGFSRSAIATEVGRSPDTVGRVCARFNLGFDRAATEQATRAKQADNKARRTAIIAGLYEQAEKNLARLDRARHEMAEVSLGKVVRYEVQDLPGADVHRLIGAIGAATSSAVKLEQVDNNNGEEAARSMIGALAAGLQLAAEHLPPPEDGDDVAH